MVDLASVGSGVTSKVASYGPVILKIVGWFILAIIITIVASNYLIKILQSFNRIDLKKKWIIFSIGFLIFTFDMFGFLIYCVWYDLLFRTIWSFVSITLILGAILMYYTFGQNLQKQE